MKTLHLEAQVGENQSDYSICRLVRITIRPPSQTQDLLSVVWILSQDLMETVCLLSLPHGDARVMSFQCLGVWAGILAFPFACWRRISDTFVTPAIDLAGSRTRERDRLVDDARKTLQLQQLDLEAQSWPRPSLPQDLMSHNQVHRKVRAEAPPRLSFDLLFASKVHFHSHVSRGKRKQGTLMMLPHIYLRAPLNS
ncbi:hypothetical protein PsorP6_003030 [Peronosclerospora sorghi]|uniref:Uncharacterized protein n=1 Tax=Peronosclerospora sorghi TaxID=230839 RepID=A0ACC0VS49_9STRA|nr:hypothetical protein PsorP6_003030 [Peronosclerospora sorghi]